MSKNKYSLIKYYFSLKHQPQLSNCSLLVIKPHIIEEGKAVLLLLEVESFLIFTNHLLLIKNNYKKILNKYLT